MNEDDYSEYYTRKAEALVSCIADFKACKRIELYNETKEVPEDYDYYLQLRCGISLGNNLYSSFSIGDEFSFNREEPTLEFYNTIGLIDINSLKILKKEEDVKDYINVYGWLN